jgi:excisionase family DNA binding protein
MYKNTDDLPITLTVKDIADILGISRNNAYALSNSKDFPSIRIGKKRIVIPKSAFVEWMNQCPRAVVI